MSSLADIIECHPNVSQDPQVLSWVCSVVKTMENIRESEHGSTMIAAQPHMGELTYLIHPLFLPIYANLLREKEIKEKDKKNS